MSDAWSALTGGPQATPMQAQSYPELGGMYAAWEQEDLKGIVGVTLDNSSLLIAIESYLRGEKPQTQKNPKTGKMETEWVRCAEPKMNTLGVQSIVVEVRSFLDKNVILSYYPDIQQLNQMWIEWSFSFGRFIAGNTKRFEIKKSYREMLAKHIAIQIRNTMLRALHGNEKTGVYKQTKRTEVANLMGSANQGAHLPIPPMMKA